MSSDTEREVLPEWKTVSVCGFDALMAALERAERKGYLPDAMAEEWADFLWTNIEAAHPAEPPQSEREARETIFRAAMKVRDWLGANCIGEPPRTAAALLWTVVAEITGLPVDDADPAEPPRRDVTLDSLVNEGARGVPVSFDMGCAPLDGTLVQLLVKFDNHAVEDTSEPTWTIGSHNDGEWNFVGWCWHTDEWTRGSGDLLAWLPMGPAAEPPRTVTGDINDFDEPRCGGEEMRKYRLDPASCNLPVTGDGAGELPEPVWSQAPISGWEWWLAQGEQIIARVTAFGGTRPPFFAEFPLDCRQLGQFTSLGGAQAAVAQALKGQAAEPGAAALTEIEAGASWDGFTLRGNAASLTELRRLIDVGDAVLAGSGATALTEGQQDAALAVVREMVEIRGLQRSRAQAAAHAAKFQTDDNYAVVDALETSIASRERAMWAQARAVLAASQPSTTAAVGMRAGREQG